MPKSSVYAAIIEEIFESKLKQGMTQVDFERSSGGGTKGSSLTWLFGGSQRGSAGPPAKHHQ